jgi:signal transduction histidine kinase
MTKTTVIVVEDEPIIAMDTRRRLTKLGYEVGAVLDTAAAALEAIAQCQPDLVLMDIQIHGDVNGIQAAVQIQEQYNLPVIFLTAHADTATLEQAKITQPYGYLVKPFENHDLSTAIEIALSRFRAEQATQRALEREKELHQLKARFVAIVSHELRNPLSSIQLALDLLETQAERLAPEKKQLYFQRAKASVRHMNDLLEDVLVIGEAEAGKLQCQPTPVPVEAFCCNLIEELQLGSSHYLRFNPTCQPTTSTMYALDEKLLRYILSNLLSNAIKYSPAGSEVHLDLICEPETVTFRVRDEGIGIPPADRLELFSPFHRAGNVNRIPGTGLGLSIVKQCVDVHGGSITVHSTVGVGSTFTVTLYAQAGEVEEAPLSQQSTASNGSVSIS